MIDKNKKPLVIDVRADNGEHSHFKLIDVETGATLWEEPETSDNSEYIQCEYELYKMFSSNIDKKF